MRPFIGVTSSADERGRPVMRPWYARAVHEAGGLPVALPFLAADGELDPLLDRLDGLLLTGSEDLDPALWHEGRHPRTTLMHPDRQRTELLVCRALVRRDIPTLAICGGMQNLVVATGGRLHQHLPDLGDHVLDHGSGVDGTRHAVTARPESRLAVLLGRRFETNTAHHQGVARAGDGMEPVARSGDGVLEAYEMPGLRFVLGVQWHPERMTDVPRQARLFEALVEASSAPVS